MEHRIETLLQGMTLEDKVSLCEICFPPFKATVQEADVWSVVSAYNKLNGLYCAENGSLLRDILKQEWGFEGFVVSDWFGTRSTVDCANNGLDLEMPGPPNWMGDKLLQAVKGGLVDAEVIDEEVFCASLLSCDLELK